MATDLIVEQEESAAQEPSVIQREDDVFVGRVRRIFSSSVRSTMNHSHIVHISLVNPGLIGNGQQCFDGDCTAGNCTLVTMAGDETDVMSSFRKECILIFKF